MRLPPSMCCAKNLVVLAPTEESGNILVAVIPDARLWRASWTLLRRRLLCRGLLGRL